MNLIQKIQSNKSGQLILFVVMALMSVGISFIIARAGVTIGIIVVAAFIGIPLLALMITNIRFGYFSILISSFLISYIQRLSDGVIPVVVLEIMMLLVFTGYIINQIRTHAMVDNTWEHLKNPITISLILYTVYIHLQLFNPNSFAIMGKVIAIRFSWYNILGFIIALQVFNNLYQVKVFFKIILGIALVAALYGLSQKYIGLIPYDYEWLFSSPERMSLGVIWGQVRAWSFLNDPSNFGLLMAFCGLMCFMLVPGPYNWKLKTVLVVSGTLMFLAMVASGTRTAFVMVAAGFGIFALLTMNNIRTIIFSAGIFLVLLTIYFGPFYSEPVLRIRSAFKGNEDASMNVRSENRSRIQPYIQSHPIGGGPGTTGEVGKELAPGHPLSGFPPDSGYLKTALEMGYIGLALQLWFYFSTASEGIRNYFAARNPEIKIFYSAILASFIALCAANLTQLATEMRPFDFFIFAYLAIIIKMKDFGEKQPALNIGV